MLKPEVSLPLALAVGTMVYAIHSNATPTLADMRAVPPGNEDLDSSRKMATITSAGVVAFTALVSKSPDVFILGGFMVVAMDFLSRYASTVDPATGKVAGVVGKIGGAFEVDNTAPEFYEAQV